MRVRPTVGGLTLVLLLVVGAGIYFADRHQKSVELDRADAEALRYSAELAEFQRGLHGELGHLVTAPDPAGAAETARRRCAELPRPAEVGEHGQKASSAYRAVVDRRAAIDERCAVAVDVTAEWAAAVPFVVAAQDALDTEIPQSVVNGPVSSGAPVREELIPLMQQVKSRFEAVEVPAGREDLATGVSAALQHVIDAAGAAARELDAGRAASFTYGAEYQQALTPVLEYEAQVRSRVEAAVNGLAPIGDGATPSEPDSGQEPGDAV